MEHAENANELWLTDEQVIALRSAPVTGAPNRILIALALARGTQKALSRISGVHPSNLSAIVNDSNAFIHLDTCHRLCEAFGPHVQVDDLFPRSRREALAS